MPEKTITIPLATFKADVNNYIALSCAGTRIVVMTADNKVFAIFGRSDRPLAGMSPNDEADEDAAGSYGLTGTDGISWVR